MIFLQRGDFAMLRKVVAALFAIVVAGGVALPALAASEADVNAAIDNSLGDHARYETTIKAFQQAVVDGSKQDVAAFVRYPIVVTIAGRKRTITSAAAFVKAYDSIMTRDIVAAVKGQKYGDLFVNYQGVMFGNGEVWINGICLDHKCKSFVPKVVTIQHGPSSN